LPANRPALLPTLRFGSQRHSFGSISKNDYDLQIAKRDLGKILNRIEPVNKPKAVANGAGAVS
jgi:hypothetical protein